MKKVLLSAAAMLAVVASFGQQPAPAAAPANEKTPIEDILPAQGEIGISIGAGSALGYVGNFFGKSAPNGFGSTIFEYPTKNFPTSVIAVKYFMAEKTAIRLAANLMYNSTVNYYETQDDKSLSPDDKVNDKVTTKSSGYTISAGLEKRTGKGRMQGIIGAEAFIGNPGTASYEVEYGNSFSQVNHNPTASSDVTKAVNKKYPTDASKPGYVDRTWRTRLANEHITSTFAVGARAIVGLEYFIAPKISLGGEFLWGLEYRKLGKQTNTWEYYNTVTNDVEQETTESKAGRSFNVGLSNLNGSLSLNFYF